MTAECEVCKRNMPAVDRPQHYVDAHGWHTCGASSRLHAPSGSPAAEIPEASAAQAATTDGGRCVQCGTTASGPEDLFCANCGTRMPPRNLVLAPSRPGMFQQARGRATEATKNLQFKVAPFSGPSGSQFLGLAQGLKLHFTSTGHGPTELPAYLYFFTDALAVRRADAPPMSAVLVPGLHMLLPHVAAAHLLYKTGRTLHANSALVEGTHALSDEVQDLTSHQFASADPLVLRLPVSGIATCFVRRNAIGAVSVVIRPEGDADDTKLKSSLPVPSAAYEDFRRLLEKAVTATRVMDGAPPEQAP